MPIPICDSAGNDAGRLATRVLRDMNDGLPVESLLTHRYSINKMNEATEMNISMKGMKIAFLKKRFEQE